ncbi:hypothetical protein MRX96_040088 [Rhipicephalus microplus]
MCYSFAYFKLRCFRITFGFCRYQAIRVKHSMSWHIFLAHFSAQKARYTALNSPGSHCRDLSDLRSGDRSSKKGKPEDIEMYTSVHVLDFVTRKLQVILQYMTKKGNKIPKYSWIKRQKCSLLLSKRTNNEHF